MRYMLTALIIIGLSAPLLGKALSTREAKRIQEAAAVLNEMVETPDKDVPHSMWAKARCVLVVPGLKRAAFIVGGEYGKGLASCRTDDGWSPPVFVEIAKGSWGAQIGAAEVDLILLVMNERGMEKLLQNKVTLGTEATLAAGPVGRNVEAATDAQLHAEIVSYSRSRGLFAGINLAGGVLRPDPDDTRDLYEGEVPARDILMGKRAPIPPPALPFIQALRAHDALAAQTRQ